MKRLILILIILSGITVFSQNPPTKKINDNSYSVGIYYDYMAVFQHPNFARFAKSFDCNIIPYNDTINSGYALGVTGTIPVNDNMRFKVSGGYSSTNVNFRNRDDILFSTSDGGIQTGYLINEIAGKFITFRIQTNFGMRIIKNWFLTAGIHTEYTVDLGIENEVYIEGSYAHKITYLNQSEDNRFLYFSPNVELSYDLFLGNTDFGIIVSPMIRYEYGLYSFLSERNWKKDCLYLGLSVRYTDNIYKFQEY